MKQELEERKETIDGLIKRLSVKETEAEAYCIQLKELNETHRKKENTIRELQNELEQAKSERKLLGEGELEKKLYYKKQRVKQLKGTIDELMPKITRCEEQIRDFNEILDESNRALREKDVEISKLKQLLNDSQGENKKLKEILDAAEEEIILLKNNMRKEVTNITTIRNKEIETFKNSKDEEMNILMEGKEKEIKTLKLLLYESEERIKQITVETEKQLEAKYIAKYKELELNTIEQLKASLSYKTQDTNNVV